VGYVQGQVLEATTTAEHRNDPVDFESRNQGLKTLGHQVTREEQSRIHKEKIDARRHEPRRSKRNE